VLILKTVEESGGSGLDWLRLLEFAFLKVTETVF